MSSLKITKSVLSEMQKIYEEAAKKAQPQGAQGAANAQSAGGPKDDGVVDADYEVVDEEGKDKKDKK